MSPLLLQASTLRVLHDCFALIGRTFSHGYHADPVPYAGPTGTWFGVGLNASTMMDRPYAIIVDGDGLIVQMEPDACQ